MAKQKTSDTVSFETGMLAYARSLQISEGVFFGINGDKRVPVEILEKGVRGQTSNDLKSGKEKEAANSNIQTVEFAVLPQGCTIVALDFSVRVLPMAMKPHACGNTMVGTAYAELAAEYARAGGFAVLAELYAWNIANARFAWRNRFQVDISKVNVTFSGESIVFDPSLLSLEQEADRDEMASALVEGDRAALDRFIDGVTRGLTTAAPFTFDVSWMGEMNAGQEIFPSQEYIRDDKKEKGLSRVYAKLPAFLAGRQINQASMHSQKIGAALRHIDIWHGDEGYGPIAVNPYGNCRSAFDMLHRLRGQLPALSEEQMPLDIVRPDIQDRRFAWQMEAAHAARDLSASREGGFFACLLSGTGSGKTRGAPTILAGAAFGDARPERRYFRMTLGLGLRVLASQSAREYVDDLGLQSEDVRVLIGTPPIEFATGPMVDAEDERGSESLGVLPEWLRIEKVEGRVPAPDDPREEEWLRGLSLDTERGVPAILEKLICNSGKKAGMFRELAAAPIIVGTVDHLMEVAAPARSRFLPAAIRTLSSDLILDEIDQYGPEDIAALARLVFQAATGGRRVIIMSATLTQDVGVALAKAYRSGWERHAAAFGVDSHVNLLLTGDAPGSVVTNADGAAFRVLYDACRARILAVLQASPALRHGEILDPCVSWEELRQQVHTSCSRMHDLNASDVSGFRVSFGLVKMTRISHTAALFHQLPAGDLGDRLRVKLCLHSSFPRLHRAWVEDQLKRALTRKGADPLAGLRSLCHAQDLFQRADAIGVREIEIVCVTSPVIETGNDLDFDYAILDPISMRSIVQAAGRVRRHRPDAWAQVNTLILGRSPIAMQGGKLAMPGVETALSEETGVSRGNLSSYPDRFFRDLAGDLSFDRINAAPILSDADACPLREEETRLRLAMMMTSGESPPLGRYLERSVSRMNTRFTRTRRFRRSTTGTLRYAMSGDGLEDAVWLVDASLGIGKPNWVRAQAHGFSLISQPGTGEHGYLACGHTDMRKGIAGLAALAQDVLLQKPTGGAVFAFRGRRGDRVKLLYWDGQGFCLYYKVLEKGRFPWPSATEGSARLTSAQLAMLWEGIDWRRPDWGAPPARVG